MRRALTGALAAVLLFASPAYGHWSDLPRSVSYREAKKIVRVVRDFFVMPYRQKQALRVLSCESRFVKNARNGQYLGYWQHGKSERATWGWGWSRRKQTRATKRYFVASGRDWSPWSCVP